VVVYRHVQVVVTSTAPAAASSAKASASLGPALVEEAFAATVRYLAELLDVEVNQLAGTLAFVTLDGSGRAVQAG
jgi:hypothetical protein